MGVSVPIQPRYDRNSTAMSDGRYRTRTWVREHLPYRLTWLAPKADHDCGGHEWYRHDDHTALCYHCEVGERELAPGDRVTADGIEHTATQVIEGIVAGPSRSAIAWRRRA
jgi:hypothetical protein